MTNIKERILCVAKIKGISYEQFFEEIGMSYGNFKGKAKTTPLNSDAIATILTKYEDVNPEWLLLNKGEMFKEGYVNNSIDTTGSVSELPGDSWRRKIITEKEKNLLSGSEGTPDIQRTLDNLTIENQYLKRELSSKDAIIESLIKALGKNK